MGVRAGIVVTGTEVLTGRVTDRNGPWLAERLRVLGADVGLVVVVGDRPDDLRAALAFLAEDHDLVITSGGLGPTADDLTAEIVAGFQGRPLRADPELEQRIAAIVTQLTTRLGVRWDAESTAAATRKQALVPDGAQVLEPAGTAPGFVVPPADGRPGPPVVVLPGPPFELQRMWADAVAAPAVAGVLARAGELRQRTLRLWGVPESELAATLRRIDDRIGGLEVTTCLREGELEIVSRYDPAAEPAQERLLEAVRTDFAGALFSDDGSTLDELVAGSLAGHGWTVAVAESFTAGRVAARLGPAPAGGLLGGIVVAAGSPPAGPVPGADATEASAAEMAEAARRAFGADVGVGVTAAGETKDIYLHVVTPASSGTRSVVAVGSSDFFRARLAATTLHLLRQTLTDPTS